MAGIEEVSVPVKITHKSHVQTSRTYKNSGIVTKEESDEEQFEVRLFAYGAPVAMVECSSRMTLNLGNFESVQVHVGVILPSYIEELDEAYKTAKQFVELRLNREVSDIQEFREQKKSER